jgi:putative transposase
VTEVGRGRLTNGDVVSRWRFYYHVVWATKNREPVSGELEDTEVRRSLVMTAEVLDLIPHAVGIMPDHVHIAVSIPPKDAVADVVRRLKGGSSHAVNVARGMTCPRFWWQTDYGATTFSERALDQVIAYLRNQRQHHAANSIWQEYELTADQ